MIQRMNFPFSNNITVVDKPQFDTHMSLYYGYVSKYNEIQEILKTNAGREEANATYSKYRGLKRGETYAINGVILHELYFENIGGVQDNEKSAFLKLLDCLNVKYSDWEQDFIATAKASRGWVVSGYNQRTRELNNISFDTHDEGGVVLLYPLIVLDVYEHAYYIQYGSDKDAYINAFMGNINWDVVKERISSLNQTCV